MALNKFPRKIKFETDPTQWDHHRGGWSYVLDTLKQLNSEDGVLLVSAIEERIVDEKPVQEPWIGFVHQVPRNNYFYYPDLERLVDDKYFLDSLSNCHGLLVLSQTVKDYLIAHLPLPVPVAKVLYPLTPFPPEKTFNWDRFEGRIIFIGEFLRNFQAFFDLQVPPEGFQKYLIKSEGVRFERLRDCNMEPVKLETNDSVIVIEERLSDDEYDNWLSCSIVFLNLYDAPANTTVIECMGRNTPLVVNRLPGVEEYLGKEYPLFYDTLQEASDIFTDMARLKSATLYLQSLPIKSCLTAEHLLTSFTNTAIYRSLPLPSSQERDLQFPRYDLTVIICSYKRVYNIATILESLDSQDFRGTFEVILWNNNSKTQSELADIAAPFEKSLNLRLIQSSENYYCIVRLAAVRLMRSDFLLICDDDVIPHSNYISTFVSKYQAYGPRAVLCCRGHLFSSQHSMNEESPEFFWSEEDYENKRFFDESKTDRQIHFIHADNCYISRQLLLEVSAYDMPSIDTILVDDYWLSFVLSHHLNVPLWKIQGSDIFHSTPCAENEEIALYYNDRVRNERVNFYVYHMRQGWPASAPLDFY